MEDITAYGEITASSHKGETTGLAVLLGVSCMISGIFFLLNALYHAALTLTPFWYIVTSASMAESKGSAAFLAYLFLVCCRIAFACILFVVAFDIWDQRRVALKWLVVFVLPVLVFYSYQLSFLDASFSNQVYTVDFMFGHWAVLLFHLSLLLLIIVLIMLPLGGDIFRSTSDETGWIMAVVYSLIVFGCIYGVVAQLEPVEVNTALMGNMPPFSYDNSGVDIMILESISSEYLACMKNIEVIKEACEKRSVRYPIKYRNFATKPGSARLMDILVTHKQLRRVPVCPEGGYYCVDEKGEWRCSVHGHYDEERVERGRVYGLDENGTVDSVSNEDGAF